MTQPFVEPDLRPFDDDVLTILATHLPQWRAAIAAEYARRAAEHAFWNDPRAIRRALRREVRQRFQQGYSANEEARGVDEQDSMRWEAIRIRIRQLATERRRARRRKTT